MTRRRVVRGFPIARTLWYRFIVPEVRPHLLRSQIDSVQVLVHDAHPPGAAEWAAWLADFRANSTKWRAVLVYSLGGGPNGEQRQQLTALFAELQNLPPAIVVTSSVAMRGIVTAVELVLASRPEGQDVRRGAPVTRARRAEAHARHERRGHQDDPRPPRGDGAAGGHGITVVGGPSLPEGNPLEQARRVVLAQRRRGLVRVGPAPGPMGTCTLGRRPSDA